MASKTNESLAAEATTYLTSSAGAMGGFSGIQQEIRRQAECLVGWSRKRGIFLTDGYTADLEKYELATTEHVVYFSPPDGRVIKCTKPGRFGYGIGPKAKRTRFSNATPLFYLQRIELMNRVFDADLRLEGIALGKPNFGNEGDLLPYIVTSMPYIERADKKRPHPSELDIADFMVKMNFRLIQDSCYNWFRESDGIIVLDAKQRNFISSPEGIVPIDVIIGKELPAGET
jgi:hypothetical protein